jgi:LacI family transcriptional regulator
MLIEMATEEYVREENHLKLFKEGRIDGMLLVGTLTTDTYIQDLARLYPLMFVNSRLEGLSSVVADNFQGARKMVAHLVELGHCRIGFIAGIEVTTVGEDRSRGFRDAMREGGLPLNDSWIRGGNFSEASGYEAGRAILSTNPRPSAIFAANDMMAIGCLMAARDAGLSVPRDLTVVGADDVILASYIKPSLTTLRQPMHEIGRLATETLMDMPPRRSDPRGSEGGDPPRRVVEQVIPTELVIRDSSAPPG